MHLCPVKHHLPGFQNSSRPPSSTPSAQERHDKALLRRMGVETAYLVPGGVEEARPHVRRHIHGQEA